MVTLSGNKLAYFYSWATESLVFGGFHSVSRMPRLQDLLEPIPAAKVSFLPSESSNKPLQVFFFFFNVLDHSKTSIRSPLLYGPHFHFNVWVLLRFWRKIWTLPSMLSLEMQGAKLPNSSSGEFLSSLGALLFHVQELTYEFHELCWEFNLNIYRSIWGEVTPLQYWAFLSWTNYLVLPSCQKVFVFMKG